MEVGIIHHNGITLKSSDSDTFLLKVCFDLFLQRYYYYIYHGIDTEHVAPMEDSWLENVLNLVPYELKVSDIRQIIQLSKTVCQLG